MLSRLEETPEEQSRRRGMLTSLTTEMQGRGPYRACSAAIFRPAGGRRRGTGRGDLTDTPCFTTSRYMLGRGESSPKRDSPDALWSGKDGRGNNPRERDISTSSRGQPCYGLSLHHQRGGSFFWTGQISSSVFASKSSPSFMT